MIWASLGLKLLGIGRWLKEALWSVLRWALANPWQSATIALCVVLAVVWWHDSRKIDALTAAIAVRDKMISDMKAASAQNHRAQLAQKARFEQFYKGLAHDADLEHKAQLADANAALAEYIRTHRVRPGEGGFNISSASGTTEGGSAGVPKSLPADSFVAVSDDDLHRCNALATYALDAHNWAMKLSARPTD